MNIDGWKLYYKTHPTENKLTTTQMCYEPRVNLDGSVFCMNFSYPNEYQSNQLRMEYTEDFVNFMFKREVEHLEKFSNYKWAPEVLDVVDNKIFIKWYRGTCNDMIYKTKNLPSTWKEDIESVIMEQYSNGILKSSLYPHSHYYDDNGTLRTIDFYTCVEVDNPFLNYNDIKSLIGTDTTRFDDCIKDGIVNISKIFESGLLYYSNWPENLTELHEKIFGVKQPNA